jgi:hypothetical protein
MSAWGQTRKSALLIARSALPLILLKKSKMPPQQNSRESELIAEFDRRCPLKASAKAAG